MTKDSLVIRVARIGASRKKAAALRRVKQKRRVAELVSQLRRREPRRTILDPVEYDAPGGALPAAHPSLARLLRRQG